MRILRFLSAVDSYNAGDRAGFDDAKADQYVLAGQAVDDDAAVSVVVEPSAPDDDAPATKKRSKKSAAVDE